MSKLRQLNRHSKTFKYETNNTTILDSSDVNQDAASMVDQGRRNTLKAATLVTGAAALAGSALLQAASTLTSSSVAVEKDLQDLALSEFTVQVRHSWLANDIEVVVTNSGSSTSTITDMTPSVIQMARGKFDFDTLLKTGPIVLQPGESVTVPLQHEQTIVTAASYGHFDHSIQKRLRSTMSIVTENDALAAVTIPNSPVIA